MARRPKPQVIYREETTYTSGHHSTRQSFDKKQFDAWRKPYPNGLPSFISEQRFYVGQIQWEEELY